jgi:predicted outer membrane repeat protein
MLILLAPAALAATVPGDYSTLAAACSAGVTEIELSEGASDGGNCYLNGSTLTITGVGDRPLVPVSFTVYDGSSLTLVNASVETGSQILFMVYNSELYLEQVDIDASGGSTGVLTLNGGVLEGSEVELVGGNGVTLLQVYGGEATEAVVTFRDSGFREARQGLFYSSGFGPKAVEMSFAGCLFEGNHFTGSEGAVLRVEGADTGDVYRFEDCSLSDNSSGDGGAVYVEGGQLELTGADFEGNSASGSGGAVHSVDGQLKVVDSSFVGNSAGSRGGAVYVKQPTDGRVVFEQTWLCGNDAPAGAGIYGHDLTLDLDHTALVSQGGGAALEGLQVPLKAAHMSLVSNDVGIAIGDSLTINDSLAWDNSVLADGAGGVSGDYNAYGVGEVENSSGNDLEIDDPGFDGDPTSCAHPPWLSEDSVLLGAASDGTFIGAYGQGSGGSTGDSEPDSVPWDESGTPSPDDTGGPQGQTLTWVSGGCTSGVPAASAFVLGLWLLLRRRR